MIALGPVFIGKALRFFARLERLKGLAMRNGSMEE